MNLLQYFDQQQLIELKSGDWQQHTIGAQIEIYSVDHLISSDFPQLVLLSTCEPGDEAHFFDVRLAFYKLYFPENRLRIADIGHYVGTSDELGAVLLRIKEVGSLPIVISPEQSASYQLYNMYCRSEDTVNFVSIDERPDLGEHNDLCGEDNWLTHIVGHTPNYLFNYSLIGFQQYLSNTNQVNALQDFHFDMLRLGQIRNSISMTEPILRNADFFSFDLSSIRQSDCPNAFKAGPNGLYAEEACQIIRYAGLSNKVSSGIISGWNTGHQEPITPQLIAQLIWHFMDGLSNRTPDGKIGNENEYTIYKVSSTEVEDELAFFKNNRNGRWWMNVPSHNRSHGKPIRYHMVPCNYEDYQQAMKGEIPDTWWNTYQKLS
jgi:arginase family enzyme